MRTGPGRDRNTWGVFLMDYNILDAEPCQLLCGIDSLYLTGKYRLRDGFDFSDLEDKKAKARDNRSPQIVYAGDLQGLVQGYGSKRYSYIIQTKYFTIQISPYFNSATIPPLNVQLRSYGLWTLSLDALLKRLAAFLFDIGCVGSYYWKPSRVDLCVDHECANYLHLVTEVKKSRSRQVHTVHNGENILYVRLGKQDIQARFYDKAAEILTSQKLWFYDLWGRNPGEHPEGMSVFRIEYQLRRTALKEFGIDTVQDLQACINNIWTYLTNGWLKFVRPQVDKHLHRQQIFPFWEKVQQAFDNGCSEALTRTKNTEGLDGLQLSQGMAGMVLAYAAIVTDQFDGQQHKEEITYDRFMELCWQMLKKTGYSEQELTQRFLEKIC